MYLFTNKYDRSVFAPYVSVMYIKYAKYSGVSPIAPHAVVPCVLTGTQAKHAGVLPRTFTLPGG